MSNDARNEKCQDTSKPETKFVQFSHDSIELIADSAGHANLSKLVTKNLAEDTSYRIREIIQTCGQILKHSKRSKLTTEDVDLALKWSDVPSIYGHHTETNEFSYLPELDIYHTLDRHVDLTKDYPSDKDVEVYSPMKLSVQYISSDSEDKIKTEVYSLYYEKISQSLLSTLDSVVEVALTNLSENPKLQPLLPTLSVFLRNIVGLSYENCHIVKRIPQIFNAIIKNPFLNIEPEQHSFTELLQYLLLNHAEDTMDEETYELTATISQLLCQINRHRMADLLEAMSSIISSEDTKITVKCRALMVLNCLSSKLLDAATKDCWTTLLTKFDTSDKLSNVYLKESIVAALAAVLRYKVGLLEQQKDFDDPKFEQTMKEGEHLYYLGCELVECPVMRLRCFPRTLIQRLQNLQSRYLNESSNDLYWTIKAKRRPSSREKWQYCQTDYYSPPLSLSLADVFDYPRMTCLPSEQLSFRIRNWKQKPMQSLKKKTFSNSVGLASDFSLLSKKSLKPFSKHFLSHSASSVCSPVEIIL